MNQFFLVTTCFSMLFLEKCSSCVSFPGKPASTSAGTAIEFFSFLSTFFFCATISRCRQGEKIGVEHEVTIVYMDIWLEGKGQLVEFDEILLSAIRSDVCERGF